MLLFAYLGRKMNDDNINKENGIHWCFSVLGIFMVEHIFIHFNVVFYHLCAFWSLSSIIIIKFHTFLMFFTVTFISIIFHTLTLTPLNLTKHYCRKCTNWCKSDYVIDTGSIQVPNRWPGSLTGVAWHWWLRDWCARGSGGGINTFDGVSFKWDRLERGR